MEVDKLHKLTINLEFDVTQSEPFTIYNFKSLVDTAIQRVLGQAAPMYRVDSFEPHAMRGSLIVDGANLHQIWAALSIYGMHFQRKCAIHLYIVHSE